MSSLPIASNSPGEELAGVSVSRRYGTHHNAEPEDFQQTGGL
jgi:hypothetical protein